MSIPEASSGQYTVRVYAKRVRDREPRQLPQIALAISDRKPGSLRPTMRVSTSIGALISRRTMLTSKFGSRSRYRRGCWRRPANEPLQRTGAHDARTGR
jgi:hypothetical protein